MAEHKNKSSLPETKDTEAGTSFAKSVLSQPTKRMAQNVYLVLIDGLRADTFNEMPFTKKLAQAGASGIFTVPDPTLSRPAYARVVTGASSKVSGITTNESGHKLFIPNLFDLAHRAGLRSAISAYRWYHDLLLGPPYHTGKGDENRLIRDENLPLQYGYFYDDFGGNYDDEEIFDYGIKALVEDNPHFLLIHSMDIDEMGHRHGGVSEPYRQAALLNDRCIEKFVKKITAPEESVVIITSDHGHTDEGGHGGLEKEVVEVKAIFAGKGVAAGKTLQDCTQLDLAPTIAAVLGLPFSGHMEGQICIDAFTWPEETKAKKTEALLKARKELLALQ